MSSHAGTLNKNHRPIRVPDHWNNIPISAVRPCQCSLHRPTSNWEYWIYQTMDQTPHFGNSNTTVAFPNIRKYQGTCQPRDGVKCSIAWYLARWYADMSMPFLHLFQIFWWWWFNMSVWMTSSHGSQAESSRVRMSIWGLFQFNFQSRTSHSCYTDRMQSFFIDTSKRPEKI